ncbi:type II toxin-antitoxin system RelE/ParE family toxin [Sphingomonas sanxanigenens]|uniref:Addiction module protein n=1 Tax=Sphingomonas sanxanigenens DSM 19645 = NX02 TaxID=1123269 RepID=A0A0F7JTE7_9SPHN|nr:type II toxin-antitoxin system RelE/ParE family toxin [Sphingomonas sanxanigenens]AKH18922.1 addiction module protein [Sphingomonas sanxanigenens DSM 19645 = NX02]
MVLKEYEDEDGRSLFGLWFASLDAVAAAKVAVALNKVERGAISNVKPVGEGVSEYKIDFGPGYRIYFGMDGQALVILLIGGTKKRQQRDIDTAKSLWTDYKARKKGKS